MPTVPLSFRERFRPWLILGRVSNLPTVWSNCLAAWLLGGGGVLGRLVCVWVGGSLIYVGGMFLNDAFDAEFDRRHRAERPIPLGQVREAAVWGAGVGLLLLGWGVLATLGMIGVGLGFLLVLAVLVYDAVHKVVPMAPFLMALCRYLLFLVAAAASAEGIVGGAVWSGLVLGVYVIGLSYVARCESSVGLTGWWPLLLLMAPVIFAGFMNPPYAWGRSEVLMPVLLLLIWTGRSVAQLWRHPGPVGIRAAVSGLLSGIVWVDVVAVMPGAWPWGAAFLGLFLLAVFLQRTVPAT